MIEFRDGPFIRPHPAFWRLILATNVAYCMVLGFILYQDKSDIRQWLKLVDPNLGVPLPPRSYATDCSFNPKSILDQIDIFVFAHTIGWFGKALILRDFWLCWILSVAFELMEYSLEHQLPNFAECWWDHWILDVGVSNWIGLYLGMKTCHYFEMKDYNWRGIKDIPTTSGKIKRSMAQFTPHSWQSFEWATTKSFRNFVAVLCILYLGLQCELNVFYLKYLLWIPTEHYLVTWRLILYFLFSLPAVREAYQFISDPKCKLLGVHAWMASASILLEFLICCKFSKNEFTKPLPFHVFYGWIAFGILFVLYTIVRFLIPSLRQRSGSLQRSDVLHSKED